MENVIKAAVFTPGKRGWGLPMLFMGGSGIGKSDIIEDFGAKWRMHVEVLAPGERGEGAFGVTPMPRKTRSGSMVVSYPAPDWIESFEDFDGRGIVFLDEFTTAPPVIQSAMLGIVHARRIGGATLGSGVRILCAANPVDQATNGWDLSAALANRVGHWPFDAPTEDEWSAHVLSNNELESATKPVRHDPAAEEERVLAAWPNAYAAAAGLITSFHQRKRGNLRKQPAAGDPKASGPWPSHRSWTNAIRGYASAQVHGLSESETIMLVSSFVGEGVTKEFLTFRAMMDLPDPADVLDGKVKWEHDEARVDRSWAVLNSLVSLSVSTDALRATRLPKLWSILDSGVPDDVVAMAIPPLSKARLTTHPSALPVLARIRPLLKAANVNV